MRGREETHQHCYALAAPLRRWARPAGLARFKGAPYAFYNLRQARQPGNEVGIIRQPGNEVGIIARQPGNEVGIIVNVARSSPRFRSVSLLKESFFCAFASDICMAISCLALEGESYEPGERFPAAPG